MDGEILNQRNSGQKKNWRRRESGQSQGQEEQRLLGCQVLGKSFLKSALKIRNEEKKRENTVGPNEGKKQQESEKNQCKE